VLLGGPDQAPVALDRRRVELCDPAEPRTRQPYHADAGRAQNDPDEIARLRAIIERYARKSVAGLLTACHAAGHVLEGAGLVIGSRMDPLKIANLHMRAHASEGQLFATVLECELRSAGLPVITIRERDLMALATDWLRRSDPDIRARASALGAPLGAPWRADEKAAALAAWMVLAGAIPHGAAAPFKAGQTLEGP
jgi:hypothetical protein